MDMFAVCNTDVRIDVSTTPPPFIKCAEKVEEQWGGLIRNRRDFLYRVGFLMFSYFRQTFSNPRFLL